MQTIRDILDQFAGKSVAPSDRNPFRLASTVGGPAESEEIDDAWHGTLVSEDALEFWHACRDARLFEDVDYGQWGLKLLDPSSSAVRTSRERESRPADFRQDDVVLGEFLGDLELLVLAPSDTEAFGVRVARPLDARTDWPRIAPSLLVFLREYFAHDGNKYWELV